MSTLSIGAMSGVQEYNAASTKGQSITNNNKEAKVSNSKSAVQDVREDVIMHGIEIEIKQRTQSPVIHNGKVLSIWSI